jgi:hypothetical protein
MQVGKNSLNAAKLVTRVADTVHQGLINYQRVTTFERTAVQSTFKSQPAFIGKRICESGDCVTQRPRARRPEPHTDFSLKTNTHS